MSFNGDTIVLVVAAAVTGSSAGGSCADLESGVFGCRTRRNGYRNITGTYYVPSVASSPSIEVTLSLSSLIVGNLGNTEILTSHAGIVKTTPF